LDELLAIGPFRRADLVLTFFMLRQMLLMIYLFWINGTGHACNRMLRANRSIIWDYAEVLGVITLITAGGCLTPLSYHSVGFIYLFAIIALSLHVRRWPVAIGIIASGLAWDFIFVPPRLSFSILHLDDTLLLAGYFVLAFMIGGQLAALRSANDRAKLLAKSENMHQTLLDSVAHELKTPIAVFRSAVDQLGTNDPAKREYLLGEIRIAIERLDGLVANLLNQSRLESGMLKPQIDWCDGRDLVAAACRAVGSRLKGRPLTVEIPSDFPIFQADAVLMEQSIAHLLLNAAVHTPAPGRIQVEGGISKDSKRVFIAVTDEGAGVSAELRDRLFAKFNHGPTSRKKGLGLGLSIVRGFMLAQGGDVAVESPPQGGARFTLFLPHAKSQPVPNG
jgi:K+-sensing histidine kinase KdpD